MGYRRDSHGRFAGGGGGGGGGRGSGGGKSVSGKKAGIGPSNADKIKNAATMFGHGSVQHQRAIQRFGGK